MGAGGAGGGTYAGAGAGDSAPPYESAHEVRAPKFQFVGVGVLIGEASAIVGSPFGIQPNTTKHGINIEWIRKGITVLSYKPCAFA